MSMSLFENAGEDQETRWGLFCFEKNERADISKRKIVSNFTRKAGLDIAIRENLGETTWSQTTRTRTLSST